MLNGEYICFSKYRKCSGKAVGYSTGRTVGTATGLKVIVLASLRLRQRILYAPPEQSKYCNRKDLLKQVIISFPFTGPRLARGIQRAQVSVQSSLVHLSKVLANNRTHFKILGRFRNLEVPFRALRFSTSSVALIPRSKLQRIYQYSIPV